MRNSTCAQNSTKKGRRENGKNESSSSSALPGPDVRVWSLEQAVEMAESNIRVQEKRRFVMKMLLTNNSRKMAGLPLHRKKDKRKRFFTRCNADEVIDAFLDYCNLEDAK